MFHSDVPAHRVAWASPAADPETGNIYAHGDQGILLALSRDGKLLWERSLNEEFGAITTHGGRTTSPIIEGDLVIVNVLNAGWGTFARTGNRYFAFDKKTGESVWVSSPQARHYDTNYSTPIAATVDGTRMIIVGGTDGAMHGDQGVDRRAGVEVRDEQARDQHERRDERRRRDRDAQRRELRHERNGPARRDRREVDRRDQEGEPALGRPRLPGRLRIARDRQGRGPHLHGRQRRDARRLRSEGRPQAVGQEPRHAAEGLAGPRRREAVCRDGEREVLHPAAEG